MEMLQITWFVLWGFLWTVYFMLDGFVLGMGMIAALVSRSEQEKRVLLASVGPVWNGNEVWIITAGGATFAAFPTIYALTFSYLYTPMLLLLLALIVRGVSLEFRGNMDSRRWRAFWDVCLFVGSLLATLLFGVVFGNIFQGLPMDAGGYHGSLFSMLNPYGMLTGLLFVCLFVVHGALYAFLKTSGQLSARAGSLAGRAWFALLLLVALLLGYTALATGRYGNYLAVPILFAIPIFAMVALVLTRVYLAKRAAVKAFAASCVTVFLLCMTLFVGLFPELIASNIDPAYSMNIYNCCASRTTLTIMTVVTLLFVPIVIAYKVWVYRLFRGRLPDESVEAAGGYEAHP